MGGNGFVAAFCGGLAFGTCAGQRGPPELVFVEQMGGLVSLLVWLAFGAIAVPTMLANIVPLTLVYAVLSLTVVRMLPVALATIGAGLDRNTVLFVGWFGPRGLASLVFALLALEALGAVSDGAVAVIAATVLLSVLAHGFSAAPLAARYGRAAAAAGPEPGGPVPVTPAPARGRAESTYPSPVSGPSGPVRSRRESPAAAATAPACDESHGQKCEISLRRPLRAVHYGKARQGGKLPGRNKFYPSWWTQRGQTGELAEPPAVPERSRFGPTAAPHRCGGRTPGPRMEALNNDV